MAKNKQTNTPNPFSGSLMNFGSRFGVNNQPIPNTGFMDSGTFTAGAPGAGGSLNPGAIPNSYGLDMNPGLNSRWDPNSGAASLSAGAVDSTPDVMGKWTEGLNMGLGVANVGLDALNTFENLKVKKFMENFYGRQQDLQEADFANNAQYTNTELALRAGRTASAQGAITGGAENKAIVDKFMKANAVQETV